MCIFGQRALRLERMVLSCTPHKTDLFSGLVFPIHEAPCTLAAAAKAAQCRDDAERAPRSERLLIPGAGTGGGREPHHVSCQWELAQGAARSSPGQHRGTGANTLRSRRNGLETSADMVQASRVEEAWSGASSSVSS